MMTVDRCDFQVPPSVKGWYGILCEADSKAAFWNGTDWAQYPLRAYSRSMEAFKTREAALDWASQQPDQNGS